MDFYQKYELLDLLRDEGVRVFNARETATGRRITLFLFAGEQASLHADLLEQLRASQRPGRTDLIEVGDNQGTPFVATEPLGGLADLRRKVAALPAAPPAGKPPDAFARVGVWHIPAPTPSGARGTTPVTPAPPAATAPPAPPAQAAPGEFTQMFQAPAPPLPIGEAAPPAARPPAPSAPAAPGEFTQMFQASAPPLPIGEATPPAARPPALPVPAAPGEFTQMFQASAPPPLPLGEADPPAARPPAPPAQAAPGEFTQMFQASAPPQPMGEAAPPAVRPASGVLPPAPLGGQVGDLPHGGGDPAPGEFKRMFQAPGPPQPMDEAAPPAVRPASGVLPPAPLGGQVGDLPHGGGDPAPGEFTRFFQSPLSQTPATEPVFPVPPTPPPPLPPPPAPSAPGEFTRIFGRGDMPAGPQAAAAPQAPSAGPGEYTRMFSAQPVVQPPRPAPRPAPAATPAPAPAAARKVPWLTVALVATVVVLLAVVAILAFALRK